MMYYLLCNFVHSIRNADLKEDQIYIQIAIFIEKYIAILFWESTLKYDNEELKKEKLNMINDSEPSLVLSRK